ncbi:MAG: SUMF1/EgtB/PvdO family nonheme iron enzyme [Candidatus Poribacteria bacterium]|nr:SUMF1/EgtB/PvdO family nonheme iron enzyme [Candidatus Poribacteria bacterium]
MFSQRGMRVTVRTESGKEFDLYKDSYALIIGNGAYPVKNGWTPLPGAVKDVKEVAEVLERHGFNVTLKIDVTKSEFNQAFSEFIYDFGKNKDNRLLFYYAGHGYTTKAATGEDLGYLVMLDTPNPENAAAFDLYSVDMVKFVSDSKKIHAKHVLFMFDSCFSGTVLNLRNRATPSHITDRIKNPVRQFITAGRADEPVPDRSEFKKAFLNILEGRVEEPTPDGYLTGVELGDYLYRTVPKFSQGQHPQHGKIHDQQLNTGDFVFMLSPNANENSGVELNTIATLNITSSPSGAMVYVDGVLIGTTPLDNYEIDTGIRLEKQVNIGLELSGYKSRVKKITLRGGQQFPWDVPLENMTKEGVPPKSKSSVRKTIVEEDVSVKLKETQPTSSAVTYTYLVLKPGGNNTIAPINHFASWTGVPCIHEKTKDGFYYSLGDSAPDSAPLESGWVRANPITPTSRSVHNKYDPDFEHWIYAHAESEIVYDLSSGNYAKFDGYLGIPGHYGCGHGGTIEFIFFVDNAEVYKSGAITGIYHNEATYVEFDIPVDAQKLTLIVTDAGDGIGCDHWTIGDARLLQRNPEDVPIGKMVRETLLPKSSLPQTIIGKDGAEMVLIPAGEFQMGSGAGTTHNPSTLPVHTVYVDAFYIDKYEVTVGQFNQFVRETGHHSSLDWSSTYFPTDRHPAGNISWYDAMAYAKWAGKRLSTEAEWEKAARGGLVGTEHPWGNAPLDGTQCNFADKSLSEVWHKEWGDNFADKEIDDGYPYAAPVGSYPPNGYGLYDMAGNMAEWCFDAYDGNFYVNSPRRNPIATILIKDGENNIVAVNKKRVIRGGSWYYGPKAVWIASRNANLPAFIFTNHGFRCVKSAAP